MITEILGMETACMYKQCDNIKLSLSNRLHHPGEELDQTACMSKQCDRTNLGLSSRLHHPGIERDQKASYCSIRHHSLSQQA